jgi:hypothetical protein
MLTSIPGFSPLALLCLTADQIAAAAADRLLSRHLLLVP